MVDAKVIYKFYSFLHNAAQSPFLIENMESSYVPKKGDYIQYDKDLPEAEKLNISFSTHWFEVTLITHDFSREQNKLVHNIIVSINCYNFIDGFKNDFEDDFLENSTIVIEITTVVRI